MTAAPVEADRIHILAAAMARADLPLNKLVAGLTVMPGASDEELIEAMTRRLPGGAMSNSKPRNPVSAANDLAGLLRNRFERLTAKLEVADHSLLIRRL